MSFLHLNIIDHENEEFLQETKLEISYVDFRFKCATARYDAQEK